MFTEDWGEQEVGIKNPVVVVLDLRTEDCSVVSAGDYTDISMGQVEGYIKDMVNICVCFRLFGVMMS